MQKEEFLNKLRRIGAKDTSVDPDGWTPKNPLWGHCAVVSLLAQDVFGGKLVRVSLKEHSKYAYLRSHFWNRLPDGSDVDFTIEQYSDLSLQGLVSDLRDRKSILESSDTQRRYTLLKNRFEKS